MATSTTKKPTPRKQPKKASVQRAAVKPASKTTVRTKKAATPDMQSFRASSSTEPFFTFRLSRQTLYWLILAVIVVGLAAWVLSISIRVQGIYDQIDATNQLMISSPVPLAHKK